LKSDCFAVLDIGKTLTKLTLWSHDRRRVDRRTRINNKSSSNGYMCLDAVGIADWMGGVLKDFAAEGTVKAIVPVAHGAAAALIDDRGLCLAPLDYESEPPAEIVAEYRKKCDPFSVTGTPALPQCLNLGLQLYWLERVAPEAMRRGRIVTWPQYWAWLLSGVAATEVTSLGCHTGLWQPAAGKPSPMAVSRGWAERLAPLHRAGDALGPVTEEWRRRTGLPADCQVLCGLHDSNAALLAARQYPEIGGRECTVISTGTWFVAMHSVAPGAKCDLSALSEKRDCLVNVDAFGVPVPSARFMGGRETELIERADGTMLDPAEHKDELIRLAAKAVAEDTYVLPAVQRGVGPYPDNAGGWSKRPENEAERRAVAGLYLALMTDASLALLGAHGTLAIEGRFAGDPVFTGALAALRPDRPVYLLPVLDNLSLGALHLAAPYPPREKPTKVEPLAIDLSGYAARWRKRAERGWP